MAMPRGRSEEFDHQFKIVVVGDSNAGKSCLLVRYTDDLYNQNYIATIGVDFRSKILTVDGTKVKLQIWDTAGHERFQSINSSYFRGCDGALICYDVKNQASFQSVPHHLAQVKQNGGRYLSFVLVGNKADSKADGDYNNENDVSTEEAQRLAYELEMPWFEVSALTRMGVDDAFTSIARQCIAQKALERKLKEEQAEELRRLNLGKEKPAKIKFGNLKQAVAESGACSCK